MWSKNAGIALIIGALAVVAVAYGRWSWMGSRTPARSQGTPPEQLTHAWQRSHCGPEARANLDEIALHGDRIADVEILDLPSARIFLPRRWTATTQHAQGPSPDGMSAQTGGAGTFKPWLGPGADDPCRGQAYVSIAGKRANDPRFTLGLVFRRYSTRSADGRFEVQQGDYPFPHQVVEFAFFGPENDDPDELPLLKLPSIEQSEPAEMLGDGWGVVRRDKSGTLNRIAFDARAVTNKVPVSKAVEVREGWALVVPIADHVRAKIVLGRDVPVTRWRVYGEKAEQTYRWLITRPSQRGPLPTSF